jgi:CheY-like chemotaxis protein
MPMHRNSDVFVVDDEQAIADTLSAILRHVGLSVETFYDGPSVLERLPGHAPDVLVSDVMMPVMNGISLAENVRILCPACKILLFSGNAAVLESVKQTNEERSTFEILMKPIPPLQLIDKVQALLAQSKLPIAEVVPKPSQRPKAPRFCTPANSAAGDAGDSPHQGTPILPLPKIANY